MNFSPRNNSFGLLFASLMLFLITTTSQTLAFQNNNRGATAFGMATTRPSSLALNRQEQQRQQQGKGNSLIPLFLAVVTEERTETDRSTRYSESTQNYDDDDNDYDDDDYDDLEYLMDAQESRAWEDPFHILLLGQTFEKPKVTIPYVAGSLEYVLTMPRTEATELSKFAKSEGISCLGTWPREECLSLGRQLQVRDIVCRVVPFCEGGQRGWQAKDSTSSSSSNNAGKSNQWV